MPEYLVTIPAIDLIDESITAQSAKKAVTKALATADVLDSLGLDTGLEVIVLKPSGRKVIFDVHPILSLRCTKVG